MDNNSKRMWLIVLTIIILGPLLFVGACFPIGLIGFLGADGEGFPMIIGTIMIYSAWIVGLALAIFVLVKIIKNINKKYKNGKSK